ncbi:MAG: hypothetical protein ACK4OP_13280, partial [Gemmobacter sp.]
AVPAARAAAAALARMIAAQSLLAVGTPEARAEAVAGFESVAADTRLGPEWRDLAALRALLAADPAPDPAARRAALDPLAAPGRPFRALAQEQIALALIEGGDAAGARAIYQSLAGERDAPPGLQRRAAQMMLVLAPPTGEGPGG